MIVVDTAAVLAVLRNEAGSAEAERLMTGRGLLGRANLIEAAARGEEYGFATAHTLDLISEKLRLIAVDVDARTTEEAMTLWPFRRKGLSLGDRLCIGLARARALPVLTGDRAWAKLDLGVDVTLFR